MKISPLAIVRAHRRTYRHAATGQRDFRDYAIFEILPICIAVVSWRLHAKVSEAAATALLAASTLAGTLLFGFLLQISQRALDWAELNPVPGPETSRHADFLSELAANAGYAALICLGASATYLVALVGKDNDALSVAASSVGVALTVHLGLVILMILKRVYSLTEERLRWARTGAGRSRKAS